MRERIAALEALPFPERETDSSPAMSLLDQPTDLEVQFLRRATGRDLRSTTWPEAGESACQEVWEQNRGQFSELFAGRSVRDLARLVADHRAELDPRRHPEAESANQFEFVLVLRSSLLRWPCIATDGPS
jgi:hypothetical protein